MGHTPDQLAEYFVDSYRDPDTTFSQNMHAVFGEFIIAQLETGESFDSEELLEAVNSKEEYNWEGLKDNFRIFLEKRFDRYHDGDLENPEVAENDFVTDTHYNLGYIGTEMGEDIEDLGEVFMTSVIQFKNPEEGDYAVEVEYLDEEEGLEAIKHLLENGQREKVEKLIQFGIKVNQERALKAYEAVAENDIILAKTLKEQETDSEIEASMMAKMVENSDNLFEDIKDELDF